MKKTLLTLALATALVSSGFAQGFVYYGNGNNAKVTTNSVVGGASTGSMMANDSTTSGTYYFALFYSAAATTVNGSSAAIVGNTGATYAFNDANWTFLNPTAGQAGSYTYGPGYAVNTASAGLFATLYNDASQNATLVPFTSAAQFVVIGWSANIGSTWQSVQSYLLNPTVTGWVGESIVSGAITPGNPQASPPSTPASLFGGAATTGVLHGFTLGVVAVPEPATLAVMGLGGLSLLLFRRRNS